MLTDRQIAWHIYQHFRLSESEGAILEFEDLLKVELREDNVASFVNEWDMTLSGLKDAPTDAILESLFKRQLDGSVQLKETLSLYQLEVTQRGVAKSYEKLRSMVNIYLEQKRRQKTRES